MRVQGCGYVGRLAVGATAECSGNDQHSGLSVLLSRTSCRLAVRLQRSGNQRDIVGAVAATLASAACKASGNALPRFPARRRIPAQAVALKKYRGSTGPVSSIEDSEHATAPLRHSEPLRIKHGPLDEADVAQRHAFVVPAVGGDSELGSCQRANHDSKVSALVAAEGAWDVLPDEPTGAAKMSSCIEDPELMVEQAGPGAAQARTLASHRKVLAWTAANHDIQRTQRADLFVGDVGDAAQVGNVWQAVAQQCARSRIDLGDTLAAPAKRRPREVRGLHSGEQRQIGQCAHFVINLVV